MGKFPDVQVMCPLLNHDDPWAIVKHCHELQQIKPTLDIRRYGLAGLLGLQLALVPRCTACGAILGTHGHVTVKGGVASVVAHSQ